MQHESVRILLFNPQKELCFMSAEDASLTSASGESKKRFWFLIGGKIESGESLQEAAARELYEETGLSTKEVTFVAEIAEGVCHLMKNGQPLNIHQRFLLATTNKTEIHLQQPDDWEKKCTKGLGWFSLDAIRNSKETFYPVVLKDYLPDWLAGKLPSKPLTIDLDKQA